MKTTTKTTTNISTTAMVRMIIIGPIGGDLALLIMDMSINENVIS